jgi:hypothetical protein
LKPLKATLFRVLSCKFNRKKKTLKLKKKKKEPMLELKSKLLNRKKTHQRTKMEELGKEKVTARECAKCLGEIFGANKTLASHF